MGDSLDFRLKRAGLLLHSCRHRGQEQDLSSRSPSMWVRLTASRVKGTYDQQAGPTIMHTAAKDMKPWVKIGRLEALLR